MIMTACMRYTFNFVAVHCVAMRCITLYYIIALCIEVYYCSFYILL